MYRLEQSRALRATRPLAAAGLLALLCALALGGQRADPASAAGGQRPSFVVIQTDDQTLDGLYAAFRTVPGAPKTRAMPNTLDLIAKRGMTFDRYYVPYPLCCPSRVSLLTGRYAHNHNVRGNVPPNGGYTGYSFRNANGHNLATWLQAAGYRTVHVGKFLNGYGQEPFDDGTVVPPGWDAWYSVIDADRTHYYYGYRLSANGTVVGPFGDSGDWDTREYGVRDDPGCPFAPLNGLPCYHITDKLAEIATDEMLATGPNRPFYFQLDFTAPHGDFRRPAGPEPAPRHYDWFKGARLPHGPLQGLNEGNVNDKPRFIRDAPYLTPAEKRTYRVYYQKQLDSLRSVDDGVKRIIDTLGYLHRLRNTYVLFLSDNGFFFGEHRLLGGKFLAYEPATHVPFLIRGPGIRPRSQTGELAANVDIAPTLLELAGAEADRSVDGRSLVPFLEDPALRSRRPIFFESFVETSDVEESGAISRAGDQSRRRRGGATASLLAPPKDYAGIRLGPYKYIAWPTGEKELYDITKDPYELNNLVRIRNLFPIRNFLHRELRRLEGCVGRECREVSPPLPPTRKEKRREIRKKKKERREKQRERRERWRKR
jgi:N-acetylglucosamine-6-sulfatase